jgi:hypothetical protein
LRRTTTRTCAGISRNTWSCPTAAPSFGQRRIEAELAGWGRRLHDAIFSAPENRAALDALLAAPEPRELTIASSDADLLRLPWELIADAAGKLALRVSLRRQLAVPKELIGRTRSSCRCASSTSSAAPTIAGFIDPRLTTKALLAAIDPLGEAVQLDFCRPPTLARLGEMLRAAQQAGKDYDVVHFDGHGTSCRRCRSAPSASSKSDDGSGDSRTDLVAADRLGDLLAQHRIPLVVLEACRSATVGKTLVFRSVAPRLLQAGVGSVVSMGHAVHVEAARILLDRFYRELASGTSIGHAVAQGRSALGSSPAALARKRPRRRAPSSSKTGSCRSSTSAARRAAAAGRPRQPAVAAPVRPLPQSQPQRLGARRSARPHAQRKVTACASGSTNGSAAPASSSRSAPPASATAASPSSPDRRRALKSKWVDWEINKHLELNPDADRLLPLKLERLTTAARPRRPALGRLHRPHARWRQCRASSPA